MKKIKKIIKKAKDMMEQETIMRLFAEYCKEKGEEIPEKDIKRMLMEASALQDAMEYVYETTKQEGETFIDCIDRYYKSLDSKRN